LSQFLSDQVFERDALDFFPTPIADTLDDAAAETAARAQRDKIVETFRVVVRVLALLAMTGAQDTGPSKGPVVELRRKLFQKGLTDGQWIDLTRETLRPYVANADAFGIPALVKAFFPDKGAQTSVFDGQGACSKLLAMRKSHTVAHGITGSEDAAMAVLSARIPDFEVLLRSQTWLWKTEFIVPQARKDRPDGTGEYSVIKLKGVTPRRGFRAEQFTATAELALGRVHIVVEGRAPLDLYPYIQYAEADSGQHEVFLFEEANKSDVILRNYPIGLTRSDPDALVWLRANLLEEASAPPGGGHAPYVTWTINDVRGAARRASDDYLEKMKRERVYLPHLYSRRGTLESHLSGFVDRNCTKSGMLIVGASGIGKTNTLCHIVGQWRDDAERLGNDIVLLLGGSALPGGTFSLRDILLDRLDISDSFATLQSVLGTAHTQKTTQLIVIVDAVDKHPQPGELLRQLDDLIARGRIVPFMKMIFSIGEVTYGSLKKAGFTPSVRDYYSVAPEDARAMRESAEVPLGRMTDEELADAYERYRQDSGFSPTSPFKSLTEEVKNSIRNPLFLRVVMEVFNGRRIPRRVLTAEVLLEYCNKKVFSDAGRMFFITQFVDLLYDKQLTAVSFDTLVQCNELRPMLLDPSPKSPFLQLLDEQVLEEQFKRVSAILPAQRTIAFTYDRLLEYLLLNRVVERYGVATESICALSERANTYLPLRGVLKTLFVATVDEGRVPEVADSLRTGHSGIMTLVGQEMLVELEHRSPSAPGATMTEVATSPFGSLVDAIVSSSDMWSVRLGLESSKELRRLGLYRGAAFICERLMPLLDLAIEPEFAAEVRIALGKIRHILGDRPEALRLYQEALGLFRGTGNRDGEQAVLDEVGKIYLALGDMSAAREHFEQSLKLDRHLVETNGTKEARIGEAESFLNLARYHRMVGEPAKALHYAEMAKQIFVDTGDKRQAALALTEMGQLYRRQGLLEMARQCHSEALVTHQQGGNRRGIAADLRGLAATYHMVGAWSESQSRQQSAQTIYQDIGDKEGVADTWLAMGETYRWSGNMAEAAGCYQRALDCFLEIGSNWGAMMCLNNLGAVHCEGGRAEEAIDLLKRAIVLQKDQLGEIGAPETLAYLSAATLQIGRVDEALSYSDSAVEVLRRRVLGEEDVQLIYYFRHKVLAALGRVAEANEALAKAYEDVQKQADAIKDESFRRSFLEIYPLRREIVAKWNDRIETADP
jgi:tetratricopeptide (TPR) repeat protein